MKFSAAVFRNRCRRDNVDDKWN